MIPCPGRGRSAACRQAAGTWRSDWLIVDIAHDPQLSCARRLAGTRRPKQIAGSMPSWGSASAIARAWRERAHAWPASSNRHLASSRRREQPRAPTSPTAAPIGRHGIGPAHAPGSLRHLRRPDRLRYRPGLAHRGRDLVCHRRLTNKPSGRTGRLHRPRDRSPVSAHHGRALWQPCRSPGNKNGRHRAVSPHALKTPLPHSGGAQSRLHRPVLRGGDHSAQRPRHG